MKKAIISLIVLTLSFSLFTVPAFAESNSYELDELGLTVTIPSEYDVITQDTATNSLIFSELGVSGADLIADFKASGIYLNALPKDVIDEEIVATMTPGGMDNFSIFSDATLITLVSSIIDEYEAFGIDVLEYDIYNHPQAKFIRIRFIDTSSSAYGLQFYTMYDYKAINFTLRSYSGGISQDQEDTIESIVDSIVFNTDPVAAPTMPETDPFVYTDPDTNTKFTVPANWYEDTLNEDREYIDVKFASGKEEGLVIMYGSTDLWSSMSDSEKAGLNRSILDSSYFTVSDLEEYFGVDAGEISKETYNGNEYFVTEQSLKQEFYGLEFAVDLTSAVCIRDGWIYQFQFGGTKDSDYFADFEELLNSVQYEENNNEFLVWLGVAIVVSLLVIIAIVIHGKKEKQPKYNASQTKALDEQTSARSDGKLRCPNCGNEVSPDSLFCHMCGTRIGKNVEAEKDNRV